jgi:hypothetical protein
MRNSNLARKPRGNVDTKSFALKGGINLVDAPLTIPSGMCLAAINYELLTTDGYRRADGFERFDGQASPSDASYWLINFDTGSLVEPEIDSGVAGVTSGATGKVGLVVVTSGTWATNDAAGYIILFNVVGTFIDTESLTFTGADDAFDNGFSNGMS